MAFFDNIGRKVSEAGQKVIQKTGEMSDTSRLNAQISDEEKKINAAYLQIGKLYTNLHRGDPEPVLQALVQSCPFRGDDPRLAGVRFRESGRSHLPIAEPEVSAEVHSARTAAPDAGGKTRRRR